MVGEHVYGAPEKTRGRAVKALPYDFELSSFDSLK